MFTGTHEHSLDAKGRLILPRRFRDELGQELVITKGIERCLWVYPLAEFEAFAAKLAKLPLTNRAGRDFTRVFVGSASQETIDSQGRFVVPPPLREYAGLTKELTVLGQIHKIEVWDREAYGRHAPDSETTYTDESNAPLLAELGI
jgi:MraZ protein